MILLVDDDASVRFVICSFLELNHYNVLEACNGEEALNIIKSRNDIRIILLDVCMPKVDGNQFLQEFVKLAKKSCVIVITGYRDKLKKELILHTDLIIDKPVILDKMLEAIKANYGH